MTLDTLQLSRKAEQSEAAKNPEEPVSAANLIHAMTQLIDQAHAKGIKVIGATLTLYGGANYERPEGQVTLTCSINLSATAASSMASSISKRPRRIPRIRTNTAPASMIKITCTRTMRVTKPWPTASM